MRAFIGIFACLLSFKAKSLEMEPYQLQHLFHGAENSYTRQEFTDELGDDAHFLSSNICDGVREFQLFSEAMITKPNANSLQISRNSEGAPNLYYREGVYYELDGSRARDLSGNFLSYVIDAIAKIEAVPEGAQLLRHLERSRFPLLLRYGMNMFYPKTVGQRGHDGIYRASALTVILGGKMFDRFPFDSIGYGGEISWNPLSGSPESRFTSLGHEMYHAYDSIRGLLDRRNIVSEYYEAANPAEYRGSYMENLLKASVGLPYREYYGNVNSGPGLLDQDGKPILFPAPCL